MKTIENVTLYVCEHCNRKMQRKHAMALHEQHCSKNPKNFSACSGCVFMKEGETAVYYQNYDGEIKRTVKTFHCEKFNKDLYPYKVVRKGLLEKYPESFDGMEQMPTTCEGWDYTTVMRLNIINTFFKGLGSVNRKISLLILNF